MDTKKKELVRDFKNGGREWRPKGDIEQVRVYDFVDKSLGKANPYIVGGRIWVVRATQRSSICSSPLMVAAQWVACPSLAVEGCPAAACRPDGDEHFGMPFPVGVQANGTRLNTGCSAISARTGEGSPYSSMKW